MSMTATQITLAQHCLDAAHDGGMSFPAIVSALIEAGFEGYDVNYRTASQTFYTVDGSSMTLAAHPYAGGVQAVFDAAQIERLIRWAQSGDPTYDYPAFSERAKEAGCAGYMVSFLGRRIVYHGRTAECHVERFPD